MHTRAARTPTAPRAPQPPAAAALDRATYDLLPPSAPPDLAPQDAQPTRLVAVGSNAATEAVRRALQVAATTIGQYWDGLCAARGEQVATALRDYVDGALETLD